jgi:hypothetical protein
VKKDSTQKNMFCIRGKSPKNLPKELLSKLNSTKIDISFYENINILNNCSTCEERDSTTSPFFETRFSFDFFQKNGIYGIKYSCPTLKIDSTIFILKIGTNFYFNKGATLLSLIYKYGTELEVDRTTLDSLKKNDQFLTSKFNDSSSLNKKLFILTFILSLISLFFTVNYFFKVNKKKRNLKKMIGNEENNAIIYIKYKRLIVSDFSDLLYNIGNLYNLLLFLLDNDNPDSNIDDYQNIIKEYLNSNKEDRLEISYMSTGKSISFKFCNGYFPKLNIKKGDFVVKVPKAYSALFLTLIILDFVSSTGINKYKDVLEIIKTQKEIKKLDIELENIENKITNSDKLKNELENNLNQITYFYNNTDISKVKLYKNKK